MTRQTYMITESMLQVAAATSCQAMVLLDTIKRLTTANMYSDMKKYGDACYARRDHYHDGHWWTYGNYTDIAECTGCLTKNQVETASKRLVQAGYIVIDTYNQHKYDRTLWYALTDKGLAVYGIGNAEEKPENKPKKKQAPEKKKESKKEREKEKEGKKEEKKEKETVTPAEAEATLKRLGIIDESSRAVYASIWPQALADGLVSQAIYDTGLTVIQTLTDYAIY